MRGVPAVSIALIVTAKTESSSFRAFADLQLGQEETLLPWYYAPK